MDKVLYQNSEKKEANKIGKVKQDDVNVIHNIG